MRLKVHFDKTDLVRVFDVDAKSELIEDPALRFDDLVLQRDVVRVQDHRLDRPEKKPSIVTTKKMAPIGDDLVQACRGHHWYPIKPHHHLLRKIKSDQYKMTFLLLGGKVQCLHLTETNWVQKNSKKNWSFLSLDRQTSRSGKWPNF